MRVYCVAFHFNWSGGVEWRTTPEALQKEVDTLKREFGGEPEFQYVVYEAEVDHRGVDRITRLIDDHMWQTSDEELNGGNFDLQYYTMCTKCDHFVDDNGSLDGVRASELQHIGPAFVTFRDGSTMARYVHFEDGEQEFDHDAQPGETMTGEDWKQVRPELFTMYTDNCIGPNSAHHSRRGKVR